MNVVQGIKGFLGTSLIDYPGKVAAVVFLSGCNLNCRFCHNSLLMDPELDLQDLPLEELIESLQRRRKILDGVVVSGGEPTANPQLHQLLRSLRPTGLKIKLDTNGLQSRVIESVITEGLVDYVAMDLKLDPARYPAELGAPEDAAQRLLATLGYLRRGSVEHEFRTTCVPGLVREEDIRVIARLIPGSTYFLQQYRSLHVEDPELADRPAYPIEVLERFREIARPFVKEVQLRNV